MTDPIAAAGLVPTRRPVPDGGGSPGHLPADPPWSSHPAREASEAQQAAADPPQPPGPDGWTPAQVTPVMSHNGDGFLMSMYHFTTGGVKEAPGQRLSTGQIDRLAPFYAAEFHVDEQWVRQNLAQVYVYYGGPASPSGGAMTVGHHIFVPERGDVQRILSPDHTSWLAHELTHTMQFAVYDGSNGHTFLSSYIKAMVIGIDPQHTGSGSGPRVWGAAFTGWRTSKDGYGSLGKPSVGVRQRLGFSVVPALTVGVPLGLVGGGAIAAARGALTRSAPEVAKEANLLGSRGSLLTGMGVVAAPIVAGSLAGVYADKLGHHGAQWIGAGAGAATAGGLLLAAGSFSGASTRLPGITGKAVAAGAIALAAGLGWTSATISANTIRGYATSAPMLNAVLQREHDTPSLQGALHDSHWAEIEAESSAQDFVHEKLGAHPDASKWKGVVPHHNTGPGARADWGLWNPLIIGVPLAAGAGAAVLGTRTGMTLLDQTVRQGHGPLQAVGAAVRQLGSHGRGGFNSLGVGAALTLAPLVAGGIAGPIAHDVGLGDTGSRIAGVGVAAATSGVLLTMLLGGHGSGLLRTTPKVLAGMVVAGALGLAASGVAIDALKPGTRDYDVTAGTHAVPTP